MKPIYKPKGAAAEYGDYAVNIYTGCPHRCFYCYSPQVLHRDREEFHRRVEPRKDIVAELRYQLQREQITGKLIHLCFTCDPYPAGYDTTVTREVIQALKECGNNVQILTKGSGAPDFDLLDGGDWYGVTITSEVRMAKKAEPGAMSVEGRLLDLEDAERREIYKGIESGRYYLREVSSREPFAKWFVCGTHRMPDDGNEPRPNLIFQLDGQRERVVYEDWNGVAAYSEQFNKDFRTGGQ